MTSVRNSVLACTARFQRLLIRACVSGLLVLVAASAAHAQHTVTATWDRNADAFTAGYRLFYGTTSGSYQWSVDVGNVVSAPLNLAPGRYFFAVRAYNSAYQYGSPSNEVNFTVGATAPPTATITATRQSATTALVTWQTTNATSATINGTTVALNSSATMAVSSTTSTTFTLVARNAAGETATATATVAASSTVPTATITATRQSATTALVTWQTTNATSATLNGSAVALSGSATRTVSSTTSTTFTLVARNASGQTATASATVTAASGAPTAAIQATMQGPTTARVTWQSTNAVSATINGSAVALNGSMTVNVTTNTSYNLRVRSASGVMANATAVARPATVNSAPLPPLDARSTVSGTQVTLGWQASPGGGVPTMYLLYVGTTAWGSDVANGTQLGNLLTVASTLPNGTYYARIRARNAYGTSASSEPISFRIGSQLASPSGLTANWNGTVTTLSWVASAADSLELTPTDYVLEAGTAPGLADVAELRVGKETQFSADVPYGVYYVRVRAINDRGDSNPTEDLVVAAPGSAQAPVELTQGGDGMTVSLSWSAPTGGGERPVGYMIEAGSDPGMSDLATIQVGDVTSFTTQAPPGTYFVRVRAINSRGPGLPSNEVVIQK